MTRDELLEEVARAICQSDMVDDVFDDLSVYQKEQFTCNADAVIDTIFAALKEPTEEMILAAGKAWGITVTSNEYENMEDEWRLMLYASPLAPKE